MGFAVKQGSNWAGFCLDTEGGGYDGSAFRVFDGGAADYNHVIPISPSIAMNANTNVTLKMVYSNGEFNFCIKSGESWDLLSLTRLRTKRLSFQISPYNCVDN